MIAKLKSFFLYYGIALLICVLCFFQLYLTQARGFCHWKGGGFGMFAYIDAYDTRILRVYLGNREKWVPLYYIEDKKLDSLLKLRLDFSEENLKKATTLLSQQDYIYDEVTSVRYIEELVKGHPVYKFPFDRFRFEMYTLKFDPDNGRLTLVFREQRDMYVD